MVQLFELLYNPELKETEISYFGFSMNAELKFFFC